MWTLLWVVVCFVVLSVGVAVLARSTTSRWERERVRRRRPPPPPAEPVPSGVAARLGRVVATARPTAARVEGLRRAAGHGLASVRRRGGRAVPRVTAVLRRVHLEHRHPAQLAARVVHRRGHRGPVPEPPVGGQGEHAVEQERGRRGVEP
ncbi:exported protein of unknown function [Modestobacter italicus]|uniref:Uncharacterized protein n=1 Tax=Modestobacter italicus (strain DSM 44449 / CECT 9708 / BC 501) TaxID=2732864 RepID=I4EWF6_MODI5|nr:hypothetical protein [Modestobacter marinus]CCH87719.1 exported protein of unknown function [Modestobacter marinus]